MIEAALHRATTWCLGKMSVVIPEGDGTDGAGDVEQLSTRSAAQLREATEELVEVLRSYTEAITAMHGGSAELPARFAASDGVEAATSRWNERAFERTGSFASPLADDQLLDVEDDADEDERGEPWYDVPGVEVGYGVRGYLQPDEVQPEDASAGELGGADEVGDQHLDDGQDMLPAVLPPAGRVVFSEDYARQGHRTSQGWRACDDPLSPPSAAGTLGEADQRGDAG